MILPDKINTSVCIDSQVTQKILKNIKIGINLNYLNKFTGNYY